MKRVFLAALSIALFCQPLWAGYGLSNVVKLGIKPVPAEPAAASPAETKPVEPTVKAPQPPKAPVAKPVIVKPAPAPVRPQVKAAKVKPTPKPQPRPHVVQRAKQAVRPAASKPCAVAAGGYPFAVHLSSWRDQAKAVQELEKLGGRVQQIFITKIDLGSRGVWYRVDCGLAVNREVAEARRRTVMRSGLVDKDSFVGEAPYTVELAQVDGLEQAHARQAEFRSQEVFTYLIGMGGQRFRVACGAFADAGSAQAVLNDLAALKIEAKLVRR